MRYTTIKELKSPTKVNSFFYLFDLVFIIVYMVIASMLSDLVYPKLVILFYIYSFICSIMLVVHSPFNPKKRMYQSIYYFFIKSEDVYKPISNPKERRDDR